MKKAKGKRLKAEKVRCRMTVDCQCPGCSEFWRRVHLAGTTAGMAKLRKMIAREGRK
jgi:hypothetical protein